MNKNMAVALMEGDYEYADPVSGTAILIDKNGHISFATGASGETNTIAAPTKAGQEIILTCRSHGGGNRVITIASTVNQAGNTVLTFGAARDTIKLESIKTDTSPETFRWVVTANDGVALS